MCGISGIISANNDGELSAAIDRMVEIQTHRGPDGNGRWLGVFQGVHVAFGHSRLAILDLSSAGHQPMFLDSERYELIFNGEIYNYKELRAALEGEGVSFHTQTDTEVLLRALIVWGTDSLAKFNGMWAFAFLDRKKGLLTLSRDRLGIKPLYLHQRGRALYFASEIKAILTGTQEKFPVNAEVAGRYVEQSILGAQNETFFSGIRALSPGSYLTIDLANFDGGLPQENIFWRPPVEPADNGGIRHNIDSIREIFFDAVRLRLRSDVPVGVLLSGGIDSSCIAAAMRQILGPDADLHMISAVSRDSRYDESPFIDKVTKHLGCPAHKVILEPSPDQAFGLLETAIWHNDQPIGSFSNVAHYLLMQKARELGITVILSGQGADELLCGYRKYLGFYLQSLFLTGRWHSAAKVFSEFYRQKTVLAQFEMQDAKRYLPKIFRPKEIDIRGPALETQPSALSLGLNGGSLIERQQADLCRFSVPSLVHYEDRMSMAFAREIRLPYLDYRLVHSLLPLAPEWKLRSGWTKWILRKAMAEYLPEEIIWRKDKQGFSNPESLWLKDQLKSKIEKMLEEDFLTAQMGLIDQSAFKRRYQAYCRQPVQKAWISYKDIFNPIALEIWARRFEPSLSRT